jgi:hypothetical protein
LIAAFRTICESDNMSVRKSAISLRRRHYGVQKSPGNASTYDADCSRRLAMGI